MAFPQLTGFDAPTVLENTVNTTPQIIDSDVTFTDADNDFNGGSLTITGVLAEDRVDVANGLYITVSGGIVYYDADGAGAGVAVAIGTASGGVGANFQVAFNGAASAAAIEALIESLTYANVSDAPTPAHSLSINVIDAAGHGLIATPLLVRVTGASDPFNTLVAGGFSPQLVDLDGDGDLDMVGGGRGQLPYYLENTGTATAPHFVQMTDGDNPFSNLLPTYDPNTGVYSNGAYGAPMMIDIDGDGDLDLVAQRYGAFGLFVNTGSATAPLFVTPAAPTPMEGIAGSTNGTTSMFADLDGDGDLDFIVGDYNYARYRYFENIGDANSMVLTERSGLANPLDGIPTYDGGRATLADVDGDGDLDLVSGNGTHLDYYENVGTATAVAFAQRTGGANPFAGYTNPLGTVSYPTLADINGDGYLDLIAARGDYHIDYVPTQTSAPRPFTVTVTPQNDPLAGAWTSPADLTTVEDLVSPLDLSAISLSDPDLNNVTVVLRVDVGLLSAGSMGGVTVSGSGSVQLTLTGLAADIDAFLAGSVGYTGPLDVNGDNVAVLTAVANGGSGDVALGTTHIDITAVNDAAVLTGVSLAATFGENLINATPQLLDANVSFTDVDEGFAGGALTVTGLLAEDRVSVQSGAVISLSAGTVYYDADGADAGAALAIGTVTGGSGATFSVAFNADVTAVAIDALIENLTYANVSDTPTATRTLNLNVTDASGQNQGGNTTAFGGFNYHLGFNLGAAGGAGFVDFDHDGDMDMFTVAGNFRYYTNTGTATAPAFAFTATVSGVTIVGTTGSTMADLDNDGDADLLLGISNGAFRYYENISTGATPTFVVHTGTASPFNLLDVGLAARPALADIDGDGDLDLIAGESTGTFVYYENTGTAAAAAFTLRTGAASPFNGFVPGLQVNPAFADFDRDGDLDMVFTGSLSSVAGYYENTGSATAPVFIQRTGGANPVPTLGNNPDFTGVDLNGDGAPDLMGVTSGGSLYLALNTTVFSPHIVVTVTAEAEPLAGINGTVGVDSLLGTVGADILNGLDGDDTLDGGDGADTLNGGDGADYLRGGLGADVMVGGRGNDTYIVDDAGDTTDETGGDGVDLVHSRLTWTLGTALENLTLAAPGRAISGTGNSLDNIILGNSYANTLNGLGGNDTLVGDGGDDVLNGDDGADSLDGGGQNDQLNGGAGIDTLTGGIGNDTLDGGAGADSMTGGLGNDAFVVDDGGDTVIEAAGEGTDSVSASVSYSLTANVETLTLAGSGDIDGTGNVLKNTIVGNSGGNVLHGGGDIDTLSGMDGADSLYGDAGNDVLDGGDGDDVLIGGTGYDRLTGGAGADRFAFTDLDIHRFSAGSGLVEKDTIVDLSFAANDRIDLSAIDANINLDGDQAFSFVGKFTKVAGQAVLSLSGGVTTLQLDVDGDGRLDFSIAITGDVAATTGNLYTGAGDVNGGWVL